MPAMTQAEYDAAVTAYQASGQEPIEISTMFAKIIDPATGQQKAGTAISAQINIGKWNEKIYTIEPDGSEVVDWPATLQRRWENAPLIYGSAGAGLAWILWRALR